MKIYLFKNYKKHFRLEKNDIYAPSIESLKNKKIDKEKTVYLFDETHIKEKKNKEILDVNNHINKSGTNPLLKKNQEKIKFYDITQIYKQRQKGIITTCLGKKYNKYKEKEKNPSAFLAYFAIFLHIQGYKKIRGKLINLKR